MEDEEEIYPPSREEQIEAIIVKLEVMARNGNTIAFSLVNTLKESEESHQTMQLAKFMRDSQEIRQIMFAYVFWRVKQD